jgi:hypothetical protein
MVRSGDRHPVPARHGAAGLAQSQAINGSIEGTVKDTSGSALPGVTVTVTNTDTGAAHRHQWRRGHLSPLLPLGSYAGIMELPGFKFEQKGIALSAGQTALISVVLPVSNVAEAITVTGDSAIAQPGKIDLGHDRETEIKTCRSSRATRTLRVPPGERDGMREQRVRCPRINANGSQMHTSTVGREHEHREGPRRAAHAAGVEVLVREVKVITNGFAPEPARRPAWSTTRSRRRGPTTSMDRRATASSGTVFRRSRSSWRRAR